MASDQIMHPQPEALAIDETNNYLNGQLLKLCAGPLFDIPKIGEKVYYFPQGHIEQLVASMNDELCQQKPIFDIPSKICCNVFSINLKVETNTNEIYAEVSLLPDISDVEIPIPKKENNIKNIKYFTKVLSASDTRINGGFVLYKRHAIECLPPLDMSQLIPSQEIIAKDIHGHEWSFKHTLKGTPKRHLFTSGWNEFAKGNKLVAGDSFVFLRGENGESRVGISKAAHQQCNIPTSLISKQSMHHGVLATALNAIQNKCMFVVFYKPRSSQFLVNFDKFVDGVNNKFSTGSKFSMKFEAKCLNEIRYNGTVVGVRDFSTHWKDSEWRSLEVQWDEAATIPRPDKVSPWEIEMLTNSSNIFKSDDLKHKRQIEVHDFGSKMWAHTLSQGQEFGNSSIQTSMRYSFPTMYNEQMGQAMKETSTKNANTSFRLFGVDLMVPATTKDQVEAIDSYKKVKISKIFEDEKLDHDQARSLTKEGDVILIEPDKNTNVQLKPRWSMEDKSTDNIDVLKSRCSTKDGLENNPTMVKSRCSGEKHGNIIDPEGELVDEDALIIPEGPMNCARSKKFKEAVSGMLRSVGEQEEIHGQSLIHDTLTTFTQTTDQASLGRRSN